MLRYVFDDSPSSNRRSASFTHFKTGVRPLSSLKTPTLKLSFSGRASFLNASVKPKIESGGAAVTCSNINKTFKNGT